MGLSLAGRWRVGENFADLGGGSFLTSFESSIMFHSRLVIDFALGEPSELVPGRSVVRRRKPLFDPWTFQ